MKLHFVNGVLPGGREELYVSRGRIVEEASDAVRVDLNGDWLLPAGFDLFGYLTHATDHTAALAGGYTTVVTAPDGAADGGLQVLRWGRILAAPGELADLAMSVERGCIGLCDGLKGVEGSDVLRNALAYASTLKVPVCMRPVDRVLEGGGVIRAGVRAAETGLPGVTDSAEAIGVIRAALLARDTDVPLILGPIRSKEGIEALRFARTMGAKVKAFTSVAHLALSDELVEASGYSGSARFSPPLGSDEDRAALASALRTGELDGVVSLHRPLPPRKVQLPLQQATPGQASYAWALSLLVEALGEDIDAVSQAFSVGPAACLDRVRGLHVGQAADLVRYRPAVTWSLDGDVPQGAFSNTALAGRQMRGRVVTTWQNGKAVWEA